MTSLIFKATEFVSAVRRFMGLDARVTALSTEDASSVSSVRSALLSVRRSFIDAAAFSGCLNVLMLSGSIFMLQVYDRVLPGHSLPTLQALVLLIIGIYGLIGVLELIRSRLFARIGRYVEANLSDAVFDQSTRQALGHGGNAKSALIRDLGQIRAFLSGGGPSALFDLPWTPLYIALLFLLHPWLGVVGLGGILLLTALTWLTDRGTRGPQGDATKRQLEAQGVSEAAFTGAETVKALGMVGVFRKRWIEANAAAGQQTVQASDVTAAYGALSRFSRMSLQSIVLAVGAWLVIIGEGTGGIMIAASILLGRALAPVELAISHWKGFVSARQAYERLDKALVAPPADTSLQLPAPTSGVSISDLYVATPETNKVTLQRVQFGLSAGDGLAVIGPSGSGKSTLVRALVGVWPVARGKVQFDGSTLDQWSGEAAGRFLGYLPQSVELFDGTIGANIARFDPEATTEAILKAARQAGVDKLVRGMERGFDTPVGPGGSHLSVGQRQRIALARALYGDPFFVVLDEPNSALDAEGEYALIHAISQVRARGGIAIIVAHRPGILQTANKALVLADGTQKAFGPREEIFKQAVAPVAVPSKAEGVA